MRALLAHLTLLPIVLGQVATGFAILSFFRRDTLTRMSRLELVGNALLAGMGVQSLLALLLIFTGLPLSGYWIFGLSMLAIIIVVLRRQRYPNHSGFDTCKVGQAFLPVRWDRQECLSYAIAILLFAWLALTVFTFRRVDYDSLAIWDYRVQVLLAERTLYTPALRDPMRMVAQPLHPYLLPVIETIYCLPFGTAKALPIQAPHFLIYLGYLSLAAAYIRRIPVRRGLAAIALLGLPALPIAWIMISPREPVMAVFACAAIIYLIRWSEDQRPEWLALSALFALLMQQIKIEGLAFLAGWTCSAAVLTLIARQRSAFIQFAISAIAILLLALPWAIVKKGIPPAHMDAFMADYTSIFHVPWRHAYSVAYMMLAEVFARPDLYGISTWIGLYALITGWHSQNRARRLALLLAPLIYFSAIGAIYMIRQDQLSAERNYSITRRMIVAMPALLTICFCATPRKR